MNYLTHIHHSPFGISQVLYLNLRDVLTHIKLKDKLPSIYINQRENNLIYQKIFSWKLTKEKDEKIRVINKGYNFKFESEMLRFSERK